MKITSDHIDLSNNTVLQQYSKMPFTGLISLWTGKTAPDGALFCDGSEKNTATYPELSAVLNFKYGGSAISGKFNVPNLQGRFPLGADNNDTITNEDARNGGSLTISSIGHEHYANLSSIYNNSVTWSNPEIGNGSRSYQFQVLSRSISIPANTSKSQKNFLPKYTVINYIIHT